MMVRFLGRYAALAALLGTFVTSAHAGTLFDQDVTPDVIFGSGNANGGFTVDRNNGIELGLRGKLRFNDSNQPENTFNSNGDGTYTFRVGTPPTGFSSDPNSPTTPVWNFEWSINTDFDGSSGPNLNELTYELGLDADPSSGEDFFKFDPINVQSAGHAIGTNTTGNGDGTVASSPGNYQALIGSNNVAQNSWSYEFFNDLGDVLDGFDPNVTGQYTIYLAAFNGEDEVARTTILVNTVPEPASVLSFAGLGACVAFGVARRRRRRAAA